MKLLKAGKSPPFLLNNIMMKKNIRFNGDVSIKLVDNRKWDNGLWETQSDLVWMMDYTNPSMGSITVPKGFTTDLISVPKWARALVAPTDPKVLRAALIHDYIYDSIRNNNIIECAKDFKTADKILRDASISTGCNRNKAYIIYFAVRLYSIYLERYKKIKGYYPKI